MIRIIKCWLKGHKFMMAYNPSKRYYHPSHNDKCIWCQKERLRTM